MLLAGIYILDILIYIFLVVRGLQQAKGKYKGRANMVTATVLSVLSFSSLFSTLTKVIRGTESIEAIIAPIIVTSVLLFYATYANKVANENNSQY